MCTIFINFLQTEKTDNQYDQFNHQNSIAWINKMFIERLFIKA